MHHREMVRGVAELVRRAHNRGEGRLRLVRSPGDFVAALEPLLDAMLPAPSADPSPSPEGFMDDGGFILPEEVDIYDASPRTSPAPSASSGLSSLPSRSPSPVSP